MPNIFGKRLESYGHLAAQAATPAMRQMIMDSRGRITNQRHDFDALKKLRALSARFMDGRLSDAELTTQAFGFLTNNLEAIQSEMEEILYQITRYDQWLPIETNIPEGAQSYAYRVLDKHGKGGFINHHGTNAGNAGATVKKIAYAIGYGGLCANWTLEDLRAAMFAGIAIDSETIDAGTRGCIDHIESVALNGDSDYSFEGILDLTGVTVGASTKTFASSTALEIATEIQGQISDYIAQSSNILASNLRSVLALYLPTTQYTDLVTRPLGNNMDKTVWNFIETRNAWTIRTGQPLKLIEIVELDQAGAASADRMIIAPPEEKRVWEMALPISPRVITTVNKGFSIDVPMEYKVSGVNVKRPDGILYVDGI